MSNISVDRPAATDDADVVTLTITHPERSAAFEFGANPPFTVDAAIDRIETEA